MLQDNKGASSCIKQLKPNQGNAGLGYVMAADASQEDEFANRKSKIEHICMNTRSSRLSFKEAKQLLDQRLLMQTKYSLHLSQFSEKQCKTLTVLINSTFLPKLHIHSKMKRAVVWGPRSHGGLGLNTDIYSVQCQCALSYLLRTMRWNKTVANDIIVTLNAFQIISGFSTAVLEDTKIPIKYAGKGWLPHLRDMLRKIDGGVWIEHAWQPRRQRQYDCALMERFASEPLITAKMLELVNEIRMWMRITFISELASIDGVLIPRERICNDSEWRATPVKGMVWPNTIHPTELHWKTLRKCLRLTFCTNTSPYGIVRDYTLDQKLGKWYPVQRYIQYPAYRLKDYILVREEQGLHKATASGNGFFDISTEVEDDIIPKKAQPIEPNYSSPTQLWTHKPRILVRPKTPDYPLQVLESQLDPEEEYDRLDIISDAAVHVSRHKSAISWQIIAPDGRKNRYALLLQMKDESYSYREELLGIYHCISLTISKFRRTNSITCHCDCESALTKTKAPPMFPAQFLSPDMDIVLAIQKLVAKSIANISFNHIEGHPEKRKRRENFTMIEKANWECDRDAEDCINSSAIPFQYSPLKGSKCLIRIGPNWLSGRPDWAIQQAYALPELEAYISERLKIAPETVQTIDTKSIGAVRATQEWSKFARSSKLLYSWLPVGHNHHHYSDMDNDRCPCCGEPDETFFHLFECTNRQLVELRKELFETIETTMKENKFPSTVSDPMINILKGVCNETQFQRPPNSAIASAWDEQESIGFKNMAIGWLSKGWTSAFKAAGSKDPEGCTIQILTLIWEGLCEPLWSMRNDILHNKPNPRAITEMNNLLERLQWYRDNKRLVLAPRHHMLAEYTDLNIERWNRVQRRNQLKILEDAKNIYSIECRQRSSGQRVLTDMFPPRL